MYVRWHRQYSLSIPDDGIDNLGSTEAESPAARPSLALFPIKLRVAVKQRKDFITSLNSPENVPGS